MLDNLLDMSIASMTDSSAMHIDIFHTLKVQYRRLARCAEFKHEGR